MARHKHIYNSARWQRVRALKLRECPLCEYCPPTLQKTATEVDHFKSIEDGGAPFDLANLRSSGKHAVRNSQHLAKADDALYLF